MRKMRRLKGIAKRNFHSIRNYLRYCPFGTLVRMACQLNSFEWPDDLPGKPYEFDDLCREDKGIFTSPIYHEIQRMVGDKAILRYACKSDQSKNDQEFDDWWEYINQRNKKDEIVKAICFFLLLISNLLYSISDLIELLT